MKSGFVVQISTTVARYNKLLEKKPDGMLLLAVVKAGEGRS